MCRLCQGGDAPLCKECHYKLIRYTHYLREKGGEELVNEVEEMCSRNESLGLWVPEVYVKRNAVNVGTCVQCGSEFLQANREKTCVDCKKLENNYRSMVTKAKRMGGITEGMADIEDVYARRMAAGLKVPKLYVRRKIDEEPELQFGHKLTEARGTKRPAKIGKYRSKDVL